MVRLCPEKSLNLKGVTHPIQCLLWRRPRPRSLLWPYPSPSSCVVASPLVERDVDFGGPTLHVTSLSDVSESTADACVPTRSKAGELSGFGGSPSEAADSSYGIGTLGGHRFSLLTFPLEE
jgi:hypothetical protein